jgi:SagB-type dehydrogenase family enzyme
VAPAVRLRRAAALILSLDAQRVIGEGFLAGVRAELSPVAVGLLVALHDWWAPEALFAPILDRDARREVAGELTRLIDLAFIVVDGSSAAELDRRYRDEWKWGATAGLYHFGMKDPRYLEPAVVFQLLTERAATVPQPPLFAVNDGLPMTPLAAPADDAAVAFMAGRRSTRAFDPSRPLALTALADCLYAGFAILGFGESGVAGEGSLPLTPTPSGGARNPFEAYVVARAVEGLPPGVYHYAGIDHSLGQVRAGLPAGIETLLGGQAWFADAAAVVFLVASFERCWWKYPHPTGFRVVLLEAGHIAQNLLLAASAHALAATPTCALSDRAVEELLGLDRLTQAAVHSVALGVRAAEPSPYDMRGLRGNPRLPRYRPSS